MNGAMNWPRLQPGGTVHLVAPSGPFDAEALEAGVSLLRERYRVLARDDLHARAGFLAGDDDRRANELLQALEDDRVDAVLAARGGYGATRILGRVWPRATRALARRPKLLVGFSDVTALHALWQRAGVGSLHGHMAARLARLAPPLQARWFEAVEGRFPTQLTGLTAIAPGRARGPLAGGNLAVLHALLGTPHMPELSGRVLFLEDVNERPYSVDRMLTALRDSGALERVAGVVLGSFTGSDPGEAGTSVQHVLAERLADLGRPVALGLPAGHVDDNRELPLGATVELDADAGTLQLPQFD